MYTLLILHDCQTFDIVKETLLPLSSTPVVLNIGGEVTPLGSFSRKPHMDMWSGKRDIVCQPKVSAQLPQLSTTEWGQLGQIKHEETIFQILAKSCEWAFFPWSGYLTDTLLAFVTQDPTLADALIIAGATRTKSLRARHAYGSEFLVARYDKIDTTIEKLQGVIWDGGYPEHTAAKLAWRLGEREGNPPFLVCDFVSEERWADFTDSFSEWGRVLHEEKEGWPPHVFQTVTILYQATKQEGFYRFWNPHYHDDPCATYVTSGLADGRHILRQIKGERDVSQFKLLGSKCQWAFARYCYGGGEDESYDAFWSRDPLITQDVFNWLEEYEAQKKAKIRGRF
jgi:hypothetical protein